MQSTRHNKIGSLLIKYQLLNCLLQYSIGEKQKKKSGQNVF